MKSNPLTEGGFSNIRKPPSVITSPVGCDDPTCLNHGASPASWRFILKSIKLITIWACP